jgi:hypothetical protein
VALQIGKNPVPTFLVQRVKLALEKCLEIHVSLQNLVWFWVQAGSSSTPDKAIPIGLRQNARFFGMIQMKI